MSSVSVDGGPYLGAMLRLAWQWVWEQIFSGVVSAGYDDVNPAHVGLFRYPSLDGRRPSELADQLQITKQSVNGLLGHLEQHGYLTRESDPADGRARLVRLTTKGRKLEKSIKVEARAAELRTEQLLGPRRFAELRDALEDLNGHVTQDELSPPVPEWQ